MKEDVEAAVERLRQDPEQEQEWLRQNRLIYGGLIGIGVVLIQPFLTQASLDQSATVCVVAFSLAIPILAALVALNQQEAFRHRASRSRFVGVTRAAAQLLAFVGVVAAFWHMQPIAGVGFVVSAVVGLGVHSAGYTRLELGGT